MKPALYNTLVNTVRMSYQGHKRPVAPQRQENAREMDLNQDGYLSNREILKSEGVDFRRREKPGEDRRGILHEDKCWLAGEPNEYRTGYHSYAEASRELKKLEQKYPHLARRVSLGKSVEGRDIWALRIREQRGQEKVVITGCHHAREWMTVEIPLGIARELCEHPEKTNGKEVWIVPVVNPDGLEYSRDTDNMWRKNIRGVDLNRNYCDGKAKQLYRPKGDKPGRTDDDFEEGADDPKSENYRGPAGASEPETRALLKLKLQSAGCLDFHSYGEELIYQPDRRQKRLAEGMNQAAGGGLKVSNPQQFEYLTSGSPDELQWHHGIPSFTFEVNGCFQPHPSQIKPTVARMTQAALKFLIDV